jgi:hypothetical protein
MDYNEPGDFPNVCPFVMLIDNCAEPDVLGFIDRDIETLMAHVLYREKSFLDFVRFFLSSMRKRAAKGLDPVTPDEIEGRHLRKWELKRASDRAAMNELLLRMVPWISVHAWPMLLNTTAANHPRTGCGMEANQGLGG